MTWLLGLGSFLFLLWGLGGFGVRLAKAYDRDPRAAVAGVVVGISLATAVMVLGWLARGH
jgi:hypothetical protein